MSEEKKSTLSTEWVRAKLEQAMTTIEVDPSVLERQDVVSLVYAVQIGGTPVYAVPTPLSQVTPWAPARSPHETSGTAVYAVPTPPLQTAPSVPVVPVPHASIDLAPDRMDLLFKLVEVYHSEFTKLKEVNKELMDRVEKLDDERSELKRKVLELEGATDQTLLVDAEHHRSAWFEYEQQLERAFVTLMKMYADNQAMEETEKPVSGSQQKEADSVCDPDEMCGRR